MRVFFFSLWCFCVKSGVVSRLVFLAIFCFVLKASVCYETCLKRLNYNLALWLIRLRGFVFFFFSFFVFFVVLLHTRKTGLCVWFLIIFDDDTFFVHTSLNRWFSLESIYAHITRYVAFETEVVSRCGNICARIIEQKKDIWVSRIINWMCSSSFEDEMCVHICE